MCPLVRVLLLCVCVGWVEHARALAVPHGAALSPSLQPSAADVTASDGGTLLLESAATESLGARVYPAPLDFTRHIHLTDVRRAVGGPRYVEGHTTHAHTRQHSNRQRRPQMRCPCSCSAVWVRVLCGVCFVCVLCVCCVLAFLCFCLCFAFVC